MDLTLVRAHSWQEVVERSRAEWPAPADPAADPDPYAPAIAALAARGEFAAAAVLCYLRVLAAAGPDKVEALAGLCDSYGATQATCLRLRP